MARDVYIESTQVLLLSSSYNTLTMLDAMVRGLYTNCVGRLNSEKKERLKTGYIRRLIIDSYLCVDATEVYMILYK
jgi:hypothetical protein